MFDNTLAFCRALPAVTTEVKWDNELRLFVGEKLFAMLSMDEPHRISFKCVPAQFHKLICKPGIVPAPHLARYHWVQLKQDDTLPDSELEQYLQKAYELVFSSLPEVEQQQIQNHHASA
ncbi:MmcQ/YjbR family DNA-binding protein [Chitinophaga sp. sic0106]|uniref:MmcQ/YjbR family DNA-binding protein n=1 Tax=Chitinophaga sp. sic0106 TaxID=2854785 RepID=UPI001C446988|nr:MmcQ/YjbR family DNA-binding protein [Chitinophaga sp. sic0106]MBV7532414.1 MmcQ/YjbR family DNA-binding protein [Chitinophaga sp. sic0106]